MHVAAPFALSQSQSSDCDAGDDGNEPCRIRILPIFVPLKVGQLNEIPIERQGTPAFAKVDLRYYDAKSKVETLEHKGRAVFQHHEDGREYVEVLPEQLGKVEITVYSIYYDLHSENVSTDADVQLSDQKPSSFEISKGGGTQFLDTSGTLYLDLAGRYRAQKLVPLAKYAGASNPTVLRAENVQFDLITTPGVSAPISIDRSTGQVKALHLGRAIVHSTFLGFDVLTCVSVVENAGFPGSAGITDCKELVPPGMTPPPTGIENGPQIKPVQPRQHP
jgi:hypothetical protein